MKKSVILIIACLSLISCSHEPKSEAVHVATASDIAASNNNRMYIEINKAEEIDMFERAVRDSVKVLGTANVTDPMYFFKSGEDYYFLWISEESGSIMNKRDSETLYQLSNDSVAEVYRFLIEK